MHGGITPIYCNALLPPTPVTPLCACLQDKDRGPHEDIHVRIHRLSLRDGSGAGG